MEWGVLLIWEHKATYEKESEKKQIIKQKLIEQRWDSLDLKLYAYDHPKFYW